MDYRARSNAVRAEARAKLVELRNNRLAKRGMLPTAEKSAPSNQSDLSKAATSGSENYVTSPEILAALGLDETGTTANVSQSEVPKAKRKPATQAPVQKKLAKSSSKQPNIETADVSQSDAALVPADIAEVEATNLSPLDVEHVENEEPICAKSDIVDSDGAKDSLDAPVEMIAEAIEIAVLASKLPPEVEATSRKPQTALDLKRSTTRTLPMSISKLRPVTEQMNPYSLARLPSVGPGLIWHLQKAGVYSLDDLAHADIDEMVEKLGSITRLMRLKDWISMAKNVKDKQAKTA